MDGMEMCSRSSREEEDDEEALKWAALEKLPTYNRLRKGILSTESAEGRDGSRSSCAHEIDVESLDQMQKKRLVDRLVHVIQDDNEKFLFKFKHRFESVGIEEPTIEVRFEHLSVDTERQVSSRTLPTSVNSIADMAKMVLGYLPIFPKKMRNLKILDDVSGIIKPGRMTLLLGPPSSGKTTLLLALAGKIRKDLQVSGRVTYNGHEMHEFVPQRTSAYVSQHDIHLPELTVRETLAYSAKFQGVGYRYEMLVELSRREKEANIKPDPDLDLFMKAAAIPGQKENVVTEYILKVLGLENCADTMVGDQMVRGISGGQKKRLTTGEMLVGPVKVLFMDDISIGLDSSTTFQIINAIRETVHILNNTVVISLLQPTPETYNLFDDIILISDGVMVYQGPRENVSEFFEYMGFKCPKRKGEADFLQEVTSNKDQEQYWCHSDKPYKFTSSKEFSMAFQSFHVGRRLNQELLIPFDKSVNHPANLITTKYGLGKREIFKVTMSREWLLMKRSSFVYFFKLFRIFLMALISMTLFFKTKMDKDTVDGGNTYMASLFYSVSIFMFIGMSEISMTVVKLPVLYKQLEKLFFPVWAYSLPSWLLKIPSSLVEVFMWVIMTYYVIGYDSNVGRFIKQFLVLSLVNQLASCLFRVIGVIGRTMIIANTFGSISLAALFALGGFVLSRENVKKWWLWGYWSSPLMYAQNAITVNEFHGKSWIKVLPGDMETIGIRVIKGKGLFPQPYWYWIGVGALVGFILILNILYTLALTYLRPSGKTHVRALENLEDAQEKKKKNNRVASIELSHRRRNQLPRREQHVNNELVLPFERHFVTFNEIRYSVKIPTEMKVQGVTEDKLEILNGISGTFRPGVLTALMGVSGAGKTTLMDVLAGRKTRGYIAGTIVVSGYPKKQETFSRISGYCEQNDIHSPHVTVHESLLYSARLRLSPDVDTETRKMFVEEVMKLVDLDTLRGALVGFPMVSGLSTAQRKRLTIGVELVANPSIVFMDEPTSGLDARAASIVMRTIRNIVDKGRTVVCTIHQPSIDVFEAFDELLLLKRGGQQIYAGPLGHHSCHVINYFESILGVPKIKDGYNPASWMMEITSPDHEEALGINFADHYKNSDLCRRNNLLIESLSMPCINSRDLYFSTKFAQPFLGQLMVCFGKQYISYWRNPQYTSVRFVFTVIISLMLGTIFWDLGTHFKTQQDLFNAMGSMYAAVLFIGKQNASLVQPIVSIERTVFYRENAAGMYSPIPYAIAQVLIEIPYVFCQALVYGVIVYAMIGFEWTVAKFFSYLFFMFVSLLYFTVYGMMTVATTPNLHFASIISSTLYSFWNLFSGFVIPKPRIPIWWRWFYWISPMAWTLYGMVASQYGDVTDLLEDQNQTVAAYVRHHFGYEHELLGNVFAVVIAFVVLFAFIFAFSIKIFNFQKR